MCNGSTFVSNRTNKKKSGETNERKLNTESLVPRVTNPTRADCLAKLKVARNSSAEFYRFIYRLYVRRNSGDIDDREECVEHVVFAVLREIFSELYYRSTPHHDAVREK